MKIALVAEQASQLTPARGTTAADSGSQGLGLSTLARTLGGLGHQVTSMPARTLRRCQPGQLWPRGDRRAPVRRACGQAAG